ncbi:hypothetical protein M8C21_027161 [Ambrosia artemisiifolia]|uniref:START domain-containing protein n=1 Tax=Ambrosia artemisiifolia TaxID=4212 RepID=A0AAD5GFJ4_AMBAR|nr:hypothetical protein M8C21_027161 [Ambrosia artemisiifolia]
MNLVESLSEFSRFSEMLVFLGCVVIAFLIGVMVGWVWRPKWAGFSDCIVDNDDSVVKNQVVELDINQEQTLHPSCSSSVAKKDDDHLLKDEDLKHLWHLVEKRDGGPPWKHMMDGSTATMTYQAWQRDLETGPPQYCSMTVYEDATPELLRDFFWDDDSRLKWDDMLLHAATLEEFPAIGASVVHWIRKARDEDKSLLEVRLMFEIHCSLEVSITTHLKEIRAFLTSLFLDLGSAMLFGPKKAETTAC